MSAQFIFTMHKVGRFVAPDKDVLKDITLAFFPRREDRRARS